MNSERGRAKEIRAVFASPGLAVKTLFRLGCPPRLVLPLSLTASFGLKGSDLQPPAWKRSLSGAAEPRGENKEPPKDFSSQEVGLSEKSCLSARTATERTSSGIPSRSWGSGSETTRPWAVVGSR